MTPTPQARVRMIVVTYSPGQSLHEFMASVSGASRGPIPVTVVDNGSTDDTIAFASAQPGVDVIETGANLGYGSAANIGVAASDEEWVLVVNPDVTFGAGSVDELFVAAERWPGAGVLGPRIVTGDDRLYPSARELPSLGRGIGHALFGWIWPSNPWTAAYRRERGAPVEGRVGWVSGACMLVRHKAFESVGGFDERYFMYFEDTDLCDRLARAGWDVIYAPSATVRHTGGHAAKRNLSAMSRAHHDSAYRYLSGRYAGPQWLPVRAVLRAGLWSRYQLSRRVSRVVHGAEPTRDA